MKKLEETKQSLGGNTQFTVYEDGNEIVIRKYDRSDMETRLSRSDWDKETDGEYDVEQIFADYH